MVNFYQGLRDLSFSPYCTSNEWILLPDQRPRSIDSEKECSICLNPLKNKIVRLDCNPDSAESRYHTFDYDCFVRINANQLNRNGCPECRGSIHPFSITLLMKENVIYLPASRTALIKPEIREILNSTPKRICAVVLNCLHWGIYFYAEKIATLVNRILLLPTKCIFTALKICLLYPLKFLVRLPSILCGEGTLSGRLTANINSLRDEYRRDRYDLLSNFVHSAVFWPYFCLMLDPIVPLAICVTAIFFLATFPLLANLNHSRIPPPLFTAKQIWNKNIPDGFPQHICEYREVTDDTTQQLLVGITKIEYFARRTPESLKEALVTNTNEIAKDLIREGLGAYIENDTLLFTDDAEERQRSLRKEAIIWHLT